MDLGTLLEREGVGVNGATKVGQSLFKKENLMDTYLRRRVLRIHT